DDDPFVAAEPFRNSKVTGNPHIHLAICQHGGHCAFVGPASGDDDGYWAEQQIVEFAERHAGGPTLVAADTAEAGARTPDPSLPLRAWNTRTRTCKRLC